MIVAFAVVYAIPTPLNVPFCLRVMVLALQQWTDRGESAVAMDVVQQVSCGDDDVHC